MTSPPSLFLYEPHIVRIYSVDPRKGVTAGGTTVKIIGAGFEGLATGAPTVSFGGSSVTVTSFTDTEINGTTTPHATGDVDVVVTTTDGDTGTLSAGYRYDDGELPLDVIFRTPGGAAAR